MLRLVFLRAFAAALIVCACARPPAQAEPASGSLFASEPSVQWRLPDRLREISGLAVSPDGRLFAHDDETATIYEIDPARGEVTKAFALGNPAQTGDFEGLAITPSGEFWLTTSRGRLYRFREGADGAHVAYERFDAGLDQVCEIEGLAYLASEESLILACKRNEARSMRGTLQLYAWRPGASAEPWLSAPENAAAGAAGGRDFRPSAVEIDARTGRVLLLSANDRALVELRPDGEVLAARALARHVQPEGLAVMPDGALAIADEAGDTLAAQLSLYERLP